MAATVAMTHCHVVSTILHHLSDMKYKDRRQYGPDQPVEFLEFRPTLVPAILVNKLWAEEGTAILWKRYPHLPALKDMSHERRQHYASKVHQIFYMSSPPDVDDTLDYLDGLSWPNLKTLELEVDFLRYGAKFSHMMHGGLEYLDLSGFQSGDSKSFVETVLPTIFSTCKSLKGIRIGPETLSDDDPAHVSALFEHFDSTPSIKSIRVKSTNFMDKDALFIRLGQRAGLESLEIDLEPGLAVLPLLSGPSAIASPFASLKSLSLMCYPEVAVALPAHLRVVEELQLDIARIPNRPMMDSDHSILQDLVTQLSHCPQLRLLKIGVGLLADGFPSFTSLPTLTGTTLQELGKSCPKLEDINLLTAEPSALDASSISSEDFDQFCRALPLLRSLSLKVHPSTTSALQTTALQSIGSHCHHIEILRLKIPCQLPTLPVPNSTPQILINGRTTPGHSTPEEATISADGEAPGQHPQDSLSVDPATPSLTTKSSSSEPSPIRPLFPKLTHLAIARPDSVLATASANDFFTASSSSYSASEIVDPDLEEDLVRSWAHPVLAHFPRIEILEAWGDWEGKDNESLNYFLPTEEILASTWEFLSGIEQDLWEGDDEMLEEGDSWNTLESGEDWDKASLMNEYDVTEGLRRISFYEDEPEGMITPGRTIDHEISFEHHDLDVGKGL